MPLPIRCLVFLSMALAAMPVAAQPLPAGFDETFAVASLNPLLALGADAVIRLDARTFAVEGPGKARTRVWQATTVLNAEGRDQGRLVVWYDGFRKLKKLEGRLRDAEGRVVRKLKKEDIEDFSAITDYSLYEDNRVRVAQLTHATYPYTVEYEYELAHDGLLSWPTWFPQRGGVPVAHAVFELTAPAAMEVRYAAEGLPADPEETLVARRRTLRWTASMLPAFVPEPWGPSWEEQAPVLYTAPADFEIEGTRGDMRTWDAFGRWYHQLSRGRDKVPSTMKTQVTALLEGAADDREKARRLYAYLQQKTRYVSVQLGIGGWQPFGADYVEERGYGDCKALTNYMLTLLKAADIAAYPALIRSGVRERDVQPDFACNQFNHVVLFVPMAADTLWLETTSQTIPFGHIGAANENRHALVVMPEGGKLIRTPRSRAADNRQARHGHITLGADGHAEAEIETQYTGNQQDRLRGGLARGSGREREAWLRRAIDIPSFELVGYDWSSVEAGGTAVTLPLRLGLSRYATTTGRRLFFQPNLMERSLGGLPPAQDARTQPVVYAYAFADADSLVFTLPEGYTVEALPEPLVLDAPFGRYEAGCGLREDGTLVYLRRFEIHTTRIPPEQYDALRDFLARAARADAAQVVLVRR